MKLNFQSELMHNQKHADVMAATANFEVLQSREGDALYFSIGGDGVFYLTREIAGDRTGWNRVDLSSVLSARHHGAKIATRCFDVSRNPATGRIDIAVAIAAEGADHLYVSYGNENTDAAWSSGVTFTEAPYDDVIKAPALEICDLYLLQTSIGETLVVDALLDAQNDPLKKISRFFITPQENQKWNRHLLPEELSAGSVDSVLGWRAGETVPGLYNFGTIATIPQLFYVSLYNAFDPGLAPNPVRFNLPQGATAFAAATPETDPQNNGTRLFVAAGGALYYYAPEAIDGRAVVTASALNGIQMLRAACGRKVTAVWGVNQQGNLVYCACKAGDELRPGAWSLPSPLCVNVERIGAYLDQSAESHVIFAHINGFNLLQLTQDPVTTEWLTRKILLPTTDPSDMIDYVSFTTHMRIVDDNNVGLPQARMQIRSTSPVSVYVNDAYYRLSPDVVVQITADVSGVITIVQETQGLSAVGYHVQIGEPAKQIDINPLVGIVGKLDGINSGADLAKASAPTGDGTRKPVVGGDIDSTHLDAAAQGLQQLKAAAAMMPKDGSTTPVRMKASPHTASLAAALSGPHPQSGAPQRVWGLAFDGGAVSYHEGVAAIAKFNLAPRPAQGVRAAALGDPMVDFDNAIAMTAGDLFAWVKHAFDEVKHFFVVVIDDIQHFVIKIGDEIRKIVLDCVAAVTHAIELVFNKIKVFFEDLVKWLGFIFEWGDILRTHRVLKNIFRQYGRRAINEIGSAKAHVENSFDGLEARIRDWASLQPSTQTIGSTQAVSGSVDGLDHPQSNWAMHHAQSNLTSATTPKTPTPPTYGALSKVLEDLVSFFEKEGKDFVAVASDIKTQIIDQIASLSVVDVLKKLAALLANTVLDTVKNGVILVLSVLADITKGLFDMLEMEISIPVLSPIYKQLVGEELSMLDLVTLIVATPATVIYKAVHNVAPYPDNDFTTQLICAPDFPAIKALFRRSAKPRGLQGNGADEAHQTLHGAAPVVLYLDDGQSQLASFICNIVGVFGTVLVAGAGHLKEMELLALEEGADAAPNFVVNAVATVGYLPYVAPDIASWMSSSGQNGYTVWNDVMTMVTFAKTAADNLLPFSEEKPIAEPWDRVAPVAEAILNFVWIMPAAWAYCESPKQKLDNANLAANLFFDFSGMMAPGCDPRNYPKLPFAAQKAAAGLCWEVNLGLMASYGMSCGAAAVIGSP